MLHIYHGNILDLQVDAIVNAANKSLMGGGGVDGAIHAAAGPQLKDACRPLAPCPTGEVRVTEGFGLGSSFTPLARFFMMASRVKRMILKPVIATACRKRSAMA